MCLNRSLIGGFGTATAPGNLYWSSSENGSGAAWAIDFDNGSQQGGSSAKTNLYGVRAIRSFTLEQPSFYVDTNATVTDVHVQPTNLTQVGTISNTNLDGANNVEVSGNYAYVASAFADSLTIIDISNPASPVQVGTVTSPDLNDAAGVDIRAITPMYLPMKQTPLQLLTSLTQQVQCK